MKSNILLEAGTGELEVLEFIVNNRNYAINVIKVKEVLEVTQNSVTRLPDAHPAISGLLLCRGEIITLIDLKFVLNKSYTERENFKVIVCEFNKVKVAFIIDDIIGVHRIKWESIIKPDEISINSLVIGNILANEKIILLLDFEKIVTDISPSTGISEDRIVQVEYRDRSDIKVVIADDSPLIRKLLRDTLTKAGFKKLIIFDDGRQALEYLIRSAETNTKNIKDVVDIVITDIEMPQMDGFTLTRNIKEHLVLRTLPVIIFSSLITDELRHKGESVGANAQMSKPEIGELITMVDTLLQ